MDAQSEQPLEGATVLLLGTSYGVVTNEEGKFTFLDVPTQTYNIQVSFLGY